MKRRSLDLLLDLAARRIAAAHITDLATGEDDVFAPGHPAPAFGLDAAARTRLEEALRGEDSFEAELAGRRCFVQVRRPRPRLVIIGAVHIAQALAPMAALTGYDVIVVDPRRAFATAERLPGVTLRIDWPDEALAELAPDAMTAIVTLTHDPKLDDPALIAALRHPVFYVGALGSRKTQAARLDRLRAKGCREEDLARLHGPAGLPIGARSPAEIAASILAEMIAARRGKTMAR